ncbi:hypothetical protein V6N11_051104 [Hibiscus sabdariffa]|uniref:Uncharacterized protein n=1 Tax=Hibiscus sabdariffa TaxID=183260 RepID=A0ABR2R2U4_9ROSI
MEHSVEESIHTFDDQVTPKTRECGYFDALRETQCQRHWMGGGISTPLEKFNVGGIEWVEVFRCYCRDKIESNAEMDNSMPSNEGFSLI